jgi:hypothetical protein
MKSHAVCPRRENIGMVICSQPFRLTEDKMTVDRLFIEPSASLKDPAFGSPQNRQGYLTNDVKIHIPHQRKHSIYTNLFH